ncbi:tRNA lysidine(34) synthetase TilS [Phytohalomonas tamaricis]|uniref:tRNA lysidine(34) synthetase TilS n=1 Tax=Phytohalomonas tamaricis TaxID=2081032 RepID=UPI000D0ADBA1|nr:tRNA lysidine(34) synthetase TilS [Phytohalomonas tamaricis]
MDLSAYIDDALKEKPPQGTVWVALSGGCDSVCLLYLAVQARKRHAFNLRALHVHHGLQAAADTFAQHCQALCASLDVPLILEYVALDASQGGSLEALAREARYNIFLSHVGRNDVLWLAHHRDDQAETLLLRMLRGAGVTGLGAMPASRTLGEGRLVRPLLEAGRDELRRYARQHALSWVEDPTNDDVNFDRNYIRHRVMPVLDERWPASVVRLAATARHARDADVLLAEFAALDLEQMGGNPARLSCAALLERSEARQRLLIRHCLVCLGLPLPAERQLQTLIARIGVRHDSEAHVIWPGGEGHVWRGTLLFHVPRIPLPADWMEDWDGFSPLRTPGHTLYYQLNRDDGAYETVRVMSRRGGERLRRGGMSRRLKTLLQDNTVPPWERRQLVLAWHGKELVAVLGETFTLTADGWQASLKRHGERKTSSSDYF